ncbi:hypothetical protein LXT21_22870 [Myxococcus sp. K38C18041901]|uniref:hypothetical protein n=1 Tax=Myxococcus guangdongensis TaxID=2906760 RepID=UPI0020A7CDB5|nr:hypothetical protein [Myxococcus guangdongensis]MCP3061634.1 hypothetical protein [Myxococcus guangdongensis]
MTRSLLSFLALALCAGCASQRLAGADLDRVRRPAFISRIEDGAGPRSFVFREDSAYGDKLKKLEPVEADRRLTVKLQQAVTRFEISERLRVNTLTQLPREAPWTYTVDPARVASVLESFLVEEVPANAPDYDLVTPLGADTIVEFVVQEYGMRSKKGHAGAFLRGYGRMFTLDGRSEVWRHPFEVDQVESGAEHLDPFKVGKNPDLFRQALTTLLDQVALEFVKDLTPKDRRGGPTVAAPPGPSAPDAVTPTFAEPPRQPEQELPPGELPDPDP